MMEIALSLRTVTCCVDLIGINITSGSDKENLSLLGDILWYWIKVSIQKTLHRT